MKLNLKKVITSLTLVAGFGVAFTLVSCGKTASEITGVKYDSETGVISWDSSGAVKTYNLTVNGAKKIINAAVNEYTLIDSDMTADDGTVDVEIEGVGEDGTVVSSTKTAIVLLPSMEITVKDGYFDWTDSSSQLSEYTKDGNVVKYKAVLNGKELTELLSDTKYAVPEGNNEFRVKPVFENTTLFYSNYTSAKSMVLAAPANLNLDAGKLTWSDVDFFGSTVTYKVTVNGKTEETHANYAVLNDFFDDIDAITSFSATVQAYSTEDGIQSSAVSDEFTYQSLARVQNVTIQNGEVVWDEVTNATKYQVEINGNSVPDYVTSTSYTLGGNASASIRVRAMSDATITVSTWSNVLTANTLSSPIPYFSDKSAIWSNVHNAAYYKISLIRYDNDGNVIETVLDDEKWVSNMIDLEGYCDDTGIYKLKVAACPNEAASSYFESAYSDELEIVRLGKPTKFRISESSPQNPTGEIMITLSGTNEGAKYTCTINSIEYGATNDNSFTFNKPLESYSASLGDGYTSLTLEIKTKALSDSPINNKLYLDSNEVISLELRQLNAPDNIRFETKDGVDYVVWDEVAAAQGYGILFSNSSKSSDTNSFAIPELGEGNYSVSVYSKGDILKDYNTVNWKQGDEYDAVSGVQTYYKEVTSEEDMTVYLTSLYSSSFYIKKLATPTNIAIDSNNGVLNWDYVMDAKGYMVYLSYGNNKKELYMAPEADENGILDTNMCTIDASLISEEADQAGFVVEVYAIGNTRETVDTTGTLILDSDASTLKNSSVFHVLKATTLSFNGVNISWDDVDHAVGYTINNVKRISADGTPFVNYSYTSTSATSYAWTDANDFEAGKYKICITVEGDYINYFNSEYSNVLQFTKLKTPELIHLDNDDKSYYIKVEEGVKEYTIEVTGAGTTNQTYRISVASEEEKGNVITVDGEKYLKYTPNFNSAQNPTINVRAIGDESEGYMASNLYTYTQTTRTMDAPINPYVTTSFDETTSLITITADVENPFGKGYSFYFNNTEPTVSDTPTTTYKVGGYADLDIRVGFEGEVFVKEGNEYVYYYDSPKSENAATVYFLANVTITKAPALNGTVFTVKYKAVTKGQYAYKYEIYKADENGTKTGTAVYTSDMINIGTVDQFTLDLNEYLMSDDSYVCVLSIYSVGNGNTIISNPEPLEYEIEL